MTFIDSGSFHGAESDWTNFRAFFQSIRDTNTMIENTLTFLNNYDPTIGFTYHETTELENADYDELALKMSEGSRGV